MAKKMTTKAGKKRHSHQMDYIADRDLFRAVMFAKTMTGEGVGAGLACYRAAACYGFRTGEAAHYIGQRGGRANAQRSGR